eukprot:352431-Chlamydomonas_euryale.AAC.4
MLQLPNVIDSPRKRTDVSCVSGQQQLRSSGSRSGFAKPAGSGSEPGGQARLKVETSLSRSTCSCSLD